MKCYVVVVKYSIHLFRKQTYINHIFDGTKNGNITKFSLKNGRHYPTSIFHFVVSTLFALFYPWSMGILFHQSF